MASRLRRWNIYTGIPLTVLVVGLVISVGAGLRVRLDLTRETNAEFLRSAERVAVDIVQRFDRPVYGLNGIRGMYAGTADVTRTQFNAWVRSRDLKREFPGVLGFGLVTPVQRADLARFVTAERVKGLPDFAPRNLGDTKEDDLYIVTNFAPTGPNAGSLGLDLGSEPLRRRALLRAIDTGEPSMTAPLELSPLSRGADGVLLFQPVYAGDTNPANVEERRRALVGLVYAPILVADLLAGVRDIGGSGIEFELIDATDGTAGVLPSYRSETSPTEASVIERFGINPQFTTTRQLWPAGRDFALRVRSTAKFDAAQPVALPWLVMGTGSLASVLLALLLRQQARGRRRAELLAQQMTADLERLAQVARHTSNLVAITDTDLRITWVNEGFTRITGYDLAAAQGHTLGALVAGGGDRGAADAIAGLAAMGGGMRFEASGRRRDGQDYWLDIETQPMLAAGGQRTGFIQIGTDITAIKTASRELARERTRLDNIIEGTDVGTWEWNLDTGEIIFNERWAQIIGEPSLAALSPGTIDAWMSRAHPDDVVPTRERLLGHLHGEASTFESEIRVHHCDGHWVWVMIRGKIIDHGASGTRWMAGTTMDVTARKAAEEGLRALGEELWRNNELLESVLENLPCGLSVFGADLKLTAHNAEFRRLLELPPELFATKQVRFEDLIRYNAARGEYGDGDIEATVAAIVDRARGRVEPHRAERVRPNGLALEIRGAPMPRGGFVTTYTDVTARRQAEAEVERSAALLRGAINAIDDAFALFDPDDRLVLHNQRYRDIYPRNPVIAHGATFEAISRAAAECGEIAVPPGQIDAWLAQRLTEHRQPSSQITQRLADGRVLRIIERRMPDGHTVGVRADITELVKARDAAHEARLAAEAATTAKSRFLANMSHEIRTPMNAVLGMLTLLQATELTVRQVDYATKAEGAARSLLRLLNDILDFSKVEAGKMTLDPHPFRVDQLLRDLAVVLSAAVGTKPVEVLFDIDPALPHRLVGDALRLQQVLTNLSGNAIKFTAQGSVVLSLAVVTRADKAVEVEIAVTDTGIGIAPENQARIFSGFVQAEASTTRRFGGTGLGVAISQRLVALMGGTLQLDSELGRGSRFHFTLTLPVADTDGEQEHSRPSPPLRVLVVDDNPMARDLLQRMGGSLGWRVDTAVSGSAGIALVRERTEASEPFDVIFVDWLMPDIDGWETCRRIRAIDGQGQRPLLVMVTAQGEDALAERADAEQQLLDGFLTKPITASMLLDAVIDAQAMRGLPHPSRAQASLAGQRLAGLRLLVAEDNANNQQVARELLEAQGASVIIANDGQEAIAAVRDAPQPFDVVLMDLQMPVMDGFEATEHIRRNLGNTTLPIVAMTANVMASDRDACLAAGMNDHVGKPFDLNHLIAVLRKHAGRPAVDGPIPSAPPVTVAADVDAAAAAARIELPVALERLGSDLSLYRRMLRNFTLEVVALPAQLAERVDTGDFATARRLLHTLKGSAATLGATALSREAAHGEKQLDGAPGAMTAADVVRDIAAAIAGATPPFEVLLAALDRSAADDTVPAAPLDKAAATTALAALCDLLRRSDMAAMDAIVDVQRNFGGALGAELHPIDEAIANLEFDKALDLCGKLHERLNPSDAASDPHR